MQVPFEFVFITLALLMVILALTALIVLSCLAVNWAFEMLRSIVFWLRIWIA